MAARRGIGGRLRSAVFLAAPALWVVLAHVAPLLVMARISLLVTYPAAPGAPLHPTIAHYAEFVSSPIYAGALLRSLVLGITTTILTFLVAYPLAHYLAFHVAPGKRFLRLLLLIAPFWVSEIVRTFGIILLLARRGAVNELLQSAGILSQPLPLLYGTFSLSYGMVYALLAVMLMPLYAALEHIPPELMDAAEVGGAGSWQRVVFVVLPLARSGIGSGCALVFLLSLGAFAVPNLLGGPQTTVLPSIIGDLFGSGIGRWPAGAAFGIILLAAGLAIAAVIFGMLFRRAGEEW